MKLINKFNIKDIKDNDFLVFEMGANISTEYLSQFSELLDRELPQNVVVLFVEKGDFLSLKTEKDMNKLGWYKK